MRMIASVAVLFFLSPAFSWASDLFNAEDYNLELEGRYWKPRLSGSIQIVDRGIGSEIDPVKDLGMEEKKGFGEGRLQVKFLERNKFNFSYLDLKWTASRTLTRTLQFNGLTYPSGTFVESKLQAKIFRGGYEYDFLAGKYGFLGVTAELLFSDTFMGMNAPALGIAESSQDDLIMPLLGLNSRLIVCKGMSLTARVSGLPMGGFGYFLDAEASLDINPVKYLGISVGYRYLKGHVSYRDDRANLTLEGPYAAAKIRF